MADSKITALTAISTVDPTADPLVIVDVSDTSMAASGTTKKGTINQLLGSGGTATLASATITGDLTVDTSTLVVNSSQDRVAIGFSGNASSGRLQINQPLGSTIDGALRITDNATTSFVFNNVSSGVSGIWSSGAIAFGVGSGTFTEAMRLNSTGLGVGVTPTNDKLQVLNSIGINTSTTGDLSFRNVVGTAIQRIRYTDGSGTLTIGSAVGTAYPVELGGDTGSRAVIIDGSKNVGLGVTPSAWATYKALQVGQVGSFWANPSGADVYVSANQYFGSGADRYIANGAATSYKQLSGAHAWLTAASGTAGNAITFTQAMTLDASGRLILLASTTTPATLATNGQLTFTATSDTNLRFSYRGSDGVTRTANLTLAP